VLRQKVVLKFQRNMLPGSVHCVMNESVLMLWRNMLPLSFHGWIEKDDLVLHGA